MSIHVLIIYCLQVYFLRILFLGKFLRENEEMFLSSALQFFETKLRLQGLESDQHPFFTLVQQLLAVSPLAYDLI